MTAEQKEWVLQNFDEYSWPKLESLFLEKFGISCTSKAMQYLVAKSGLKKTKEKCIMRFTTYTMEQKQFLIKHSQNVRRKELTFMFNEKFGTNKTTRQISNYICGLKEKGFRVKKYETKNEKILNNHRMKQWLIDNSKKYSLAKLVTVFNQEFNKDCSKAVLKLVTKKLGITSFATYESYYTKEIFEIVEKESQNLSSKTIVELIKEKTNRTLDVSEISHIRRRLGIKKNVRHFYNSAKKIPDVYPIGYVRKSTRRLEIKITEDIWIPYGRYVWQQHHGSLKPEERIIHLDGDPYNCDISNLSKATIVEKSKLIGNKWYGKGIVTQAGLEVIKTENVVKNLENNSNNTKELD